MFIKNEQMKLWAGRKPPRAIQYRTPNFTARWAQFCVPMEKLFTHLRLKDNGGFPMLTKGRNAFELGKLISEAYYASSGSVHLVDHSAFDAHIGMSHLDIEREVFYKVFKPVWHREIERFFDILKFNRVFSKNGLRVKCIARRMSGDADTSIGNSIINYIMLKVAYPNSIVMVNGDDSIIFSRTGPEVPWIDLGMETKHAIVYSLEDIEYCQTKPVLGEYGWAMVKNPARVLSRRLLSLSKINVDDWKFTTAIGELLASPYDPISQALCSKMLSSVSARNVKYLARIVLSYQTKEASRGLKKVYEPDSISKSSYAVAWGLTQGEVDMWTDIIKRSHIGCQCCHDSPPKGKSATPTEVNISQSATAWSSQAPTSKTSKPYWCSREYRKYDEIVPVSIFNSLRDRQNRKLCHTERH